MRPSVRQSCHFRNHSVLWWVVQQLYSVVYGTAITRRYCNSLRGILNQCQDLVALWTLVFNSLVYLDKVEIFFWHWGRNTAWGYLRTWCWGEYLDLSERKVQEDGEYCIKSHDIYFTNVIGVIDCSRLCRVGIVVCIVLYLLCVHQTHTRLDTYWI
jgi:hypothetical protein